MRRRFFLIANPAAGVAGAPLVEDVVRALERAGASLTRAKAVDFVAARRAARSAADSCNYDAVIAAGGDGTIRHVAAALIGTETPLGIIPVGTGNVLAHEIGLAATAGAVAPMLLDGAIATVACARAGVTTGEWAGALREVFGEYRAPTGVGGAPAGGSPGAASESLTAVREKVRATGEQLGTRLRFLVGKPGLDGHSNGAEQVAVRARDAGFEVVYQGIRLTPEQIVAAAVAEDVHCVGLSILSGSHMELVPDVLDRMRAEGIDDVPVIVGGIIPDRDARALKELGVAAVFTPKDFSLTQAMSGIVGAIRTAHGLAV